MTTNEFDRKQGPMNDTTTDTAEGDAAMTTRTSPLARLAGRWVVVLPDGALFSHEGPVDIHDPANDWDPALFRTRTEAREQLDQLAADAADIGAVGWAGRVCRLGEVEASTPADPTADRPGPDLERLNTEHPAPASYVSDTFAILTPAGAFCEHTEFDDDDRVTIYPDYGLAADRARDISGDWAERLGLHDHPAIVVTRTTTTTTSPWRIADPHA